MTKYSEWNSCSLNLETKRLTTYTSENYFFYATKILFINDKLHVICGRDCIQHLIWNDDKSDFDEPVFTFPDFRGSLYRHAVVYLQQRHEIYLFGGYDDAANNFPFGNVP